MAMCDPIVLRTGERVRLVFLPALVDNSANPKASVDGHFIYQRKAPSGRWANLRTLSLATLKEGDEFKLTLHAEELLTLLEGLVPLYRFYEHTGIPRGNKTFVEVDRNLARLVSESQKDLSALLESNPDDGLVLLSKLVKWLATSAGTREAATQLAALAPEQMPTFSALLGLAALKNALNHWKKNQGNASEEFWQWGLADRAYVLSQVFAYPVVVIGSKAYVGGKRIDNKGGKEADFLLATEATDSVLLIEIKTPQTKLLGGEYREGVFPLSRELSGAVAQGVRYRQRLMRTFDALTAENSRRLTLGEPRCIIIAGHTGELADQSMRENFELQRERIGGVTIITFDELFLRLEKLVALLELSS